MFDFALPLTCQQMSRVESFFSNIKMPWEKKDIGVVPVGTLSMWDWQATADDEEEEKNEIGGEAAAAYRERREREGGRGQGEWKIRNTLYFKTPASALSMFHDSDECVLGMFAFICCSFLSFDFSPGLGDGRLVFYSMGDGQFKIVSQSLSHSNTVSGIAVCTSVGVVVSISKDKTIVMTGASDKKIMGSLTGLF